jgi:hypothetical protein
VPASSSSLWAACAATGDGERSSEGGDEEENRTAGDWVDQDEGEEGSAAGDWVDEDESDHDGASLYALSLDAGGPCAGAGC